MKPATKDRHAHSTRKRALWPVAIALLLCTCWPAPAPRAQVVNESLPQDSLYVGVGADSLDFAAQSFVASVRRVRKVGVWLQGRAGTGELRVSVMKDNGSDEPDFGFVLHESEIVVPDTAGGWYWDSTFSAVLNQNEKYWIVVDGYNNLIGTGYAAVGLSNATTSSGGPLRVSDDGGATWGSIASHRMAIHVEGDNCTMPLTIFPSQPLLCPGGSVSFGVASGYMSYIWSSGETSADVNATTLGIYTVTAVDTANCVASASVFVATGSIPFTGLSDDYFLCEGSILDLSVPPFYTSYVWSTGQIGIRDTITEGGTYWVSVTSSSNCTVIDTFEVEMQPFASIDVGADSNLCVGDTIFLDAGPGLMTYFWSDGNLTQLDTLTSTVDLWLQVVDSSGCVTVSDTATYAFNPNPAPPIVQLLPSGLHSSFANTFQWYLDGQPLPGATGQDIADPLPGEYVVVVSNAFGCSASSAPYVLSPEAPGDFVSGGFSPNGDGLNEHFHVEGIDRYPDCRLQVFNRWGDAVYDGQPYANDWDGTGKGGSPLPAGDYFYILDFGAARETLRGTVIISR